VNKDKSRISENQKKYFLLYLRW